MKDTTLYSIGHGNKKIEDFIHELQNFSIDFLLDVRSKPFSKWNPQFNQSELQASLKSVGVTYVFVGDQLGGLPEDRSCYDSEGKVVYDLIKKKQFFKQGLKRLLTANQKGIKIAVMCSESKPEECHRSKLIGQELLSHNISMNHITKNYQLKSQELVMNELTKGKGTTDLFGNQTDFTSRKSY
ncbi:DUF488 domain-containing protein [Zeaxanthinibacter sp. PT1]|uniref:DUF488 domain-containing protein n=1 Tax=Zeaxanthinibacter TaxID=561554 RepID=UPI00234A574D|nr:DUF488 domain-containing protein [Zeaxanthinibacter sp. PT1]MDC6350482.1 DUF488 domain-containing protein [Zeaxanthinibacter sp. PT1]